MKTTIYIPLILVFFLLNSCVKEKDVFDDEILISSQDVMTTSKMFSFLNEEFRLNSVDTEDCFTFNYPIQLGYNSEQIFKIDNVEALEKVANSQSSNLHINCVILPITITNNDNTTTEINSLSTLYTTFENCNVRSFKNALFEKSESCLDFRYPFEMFNIDDEKIEIDNLDEFFNFLNSTESRLAPKFVYPLTLNDSSSVKNYFDIYEKLNNCVIEEVNCFDPTISSTDMGANNYDFEIEIDTDSRISQIVWTIYLNDKEEFRYSELRDNVNSFNFTFLKSGIWDVCATVTIEDNECPSENSTEQVCITGLDILTETLEVLNGQSFQNPEYFDNSSCIDLKHSYDVISPNTTYEFTPLVNNISSTEEFLWTVTTSDSIVTTSNSSNFQYKFTEPGIYIVCVKEEETIDCSTGVSFCSDFTVIETISSN